MTNFAIMGLGFVARRHLDAIAHVGGNLVAAYDVHDSVGILDQYAPECRYTPSEREFWTWLDGIPTAEIVSICTPNYRHSFNAFRAIAYGHAVLIEKPAVLSLRELDQLIEHADHYLCDCNVVLQLRTNPGLIAYRERINQTYYSDNGQCTWVDSTHRHQVDLTYCTPRGPWYMRSWKGDIIRSGGLAFNIGIHLFDLLLWLYGSVCGMELYERTPQCMSGNLELERADVRWRLSIDPADGPCRRQMTVDGEVID